jgi:hypothetical protein
MLASAWGLGTMLGPTDNGVRCERSAPGGVCHVLRTTFFGLFGNSSFSIPESVIRGAVAECPANGVGGRHDSTCFVYLSLQSGERQLVASYVLRPQAEASARQIATYLGDRSERALVIEDSILTPVLLYAVLPILLVVLTLALGGWRRRARTV